MGLQNYRGADLADGSYDDAVAITPSDTTVLRDIRALLVTAIGQITVVTADNYAAEFSTGSNETAIDLGATIPVGTVIPIRCAKVKAATTATVVGLK